MGSITTDKPKIKSLSVVVPAYNEASRIGATLERLGAYLQEEVETPELLVVDDGSSDNTVEVVESYKDQIPFLQIIELDPNRGKGGAVCAGVMASTQDMVLFSDADLSTPIEDVVLLLNALDEKTPIAIGSRGLKESRLEIRQPFYREMMGRTFNRIVRMLLGITIRDTQCGFKLFRKESARALFGAQKIQGFAFDVEILYRAYLAEFPVAEVAVTWRNDERSSVRPIRDAARMFREVVHIRNLVRKDKKKGCLLALPNEVAQ